MILYHFTHQRLLPEITAKGLLPYRGDVEPHDVVWLTTNPDTIHACDESGNIWVQPYDCRLTLVIPLHERRLVNWGRWLRKHRPEKIPYILANSYIRADAHLRVYCYSGVLNRFRAVENLVLDLRKVSGRVDE